MLRQPHHRKDGAKPHWHTTFTRWKESRNLLPRRKPEKKKASNIVYLNSKEIGHSRMENKSGEKRSWITSIHTASVSKGLGTCCSWTTEPQYLGNQITAAVKSSRWFWLCQQCLRPFLCLGTHTQARAHPHTLIKGKKKKTTFQHTYSCTHSKPMARLCFCVCAV